MLKTNLRIENRKRKKLDTVVSRYFLKWPYGFLLLTFTSKYYPFLPHGVLRQLKITRCASHIHRFIGTFGIITIGIIYNEEQPRDYVPVRQLRLDKFAFFTPIELLVSKHNLHVPKKSLISSTG